MARRVAVTGAGGFIGRHVVAAVPEAWSVVAVSRQAPASRSNVRVVRTPAVDEPLPDELAAPFDAVIHLAGNADHGLAARAPWADLEATGVLAASLIGRVRTDRLVVVSSAAVYAGRTGRVGPDLPVEPPMAYALSKRYVEGLAGALVAGGSVRSAAILRLYNAFGPGERPSRLVPSVAAAVRAGEPFVLTGATDSLLDPIHVDDVVRALLAATWGTTSVVLDLCGGDPVELPTAIERVAHALGYRVPEIVVRPDPSQVPIRFWSDPAPAIEALAIPPPERFSDAVRRYGRVMGWLAG